MDNEYSHSVARERNCFRKTAGNTWLLRQRLAPAIVVVFLLSVAGVLAVRHYQEFDLRNSSKKRLFYIALALSNYHEVYGSYPPQRIEDKNGVPLHSWRVLLLPYFGPKELELYMRYDFGEPWNGSHNRQLESEIPWVYRMPSSDAQSTVTPMVAVSGDGTVWQGAEPVSPYPTAEDEKISVIEKVNSDIQWMEPRDISISTFASSTGDLRASGVQEVHRYGIPAAVTSGTAVWVPYDTSIKDFRKMCRIQSQ